MKIRLLGTGYGECKIKKLASRDFRRSGGVIIDDKLLIDAPADIFKAAGDLGFSDVLGGICNVVISHSHQGHFSPEAILRLAKKHTVNLYATDAVLRLIPQEAEGIRKIPLYPFIPVEVCEDYRIIPLPANHTTELEGEECLNFIIATDKTLFYALDGGYINYDAWRVIKEVRLDGVITDCALENTPISKECMYHNNIDAVKTMKELFSASEIAGEDTRFILSHIPSDKKRQIHDELLPIAREYGLSVAYDGYYFTL